MEPKTWVLSCFSCIQFFATLWAVAHQAPLSIDSPGKNTGVACHALLQGNLPDLRIQPVSLTSPALAGGFFTTISEVAQSCPTLCDPMNCSLPGSSIHGIFQARVLEWVE